VPLQADFWEPPHWSSQQWVVLWSRHVGGSSGRGQLLGSGSAAHPGRTGARAARERESELKESKRVHASRSYSTCPHPCRLAARDAQGWRCACAHKQPRLCHAGAPSHPVPLSSPQESHNGGMQACVSSHHVPRRCAVMRCTRREAGA